MDYTAIEWVASEKLFWIWSSNTSIVLNVLQGFVLFCGFLILIALSNNRPLTDGAGKVTILVSVKGAIEFGKKLEDLHLRPISFANYDLVGAYWKEADSDKAIFFQQDGCIVGGKDTFLPFQMYLSTFFDGGSI